MHSSEYSHYIVYQLFILSVTFPAVNQFTRKCVEFCHQFGKIIVLCFASVDELVPSNFIGQSQNLYYSGHDYTMHIVLQRLRKTGEVSVY